MARNPFIREGKLRGLRAGHRRRAAAVLLFSVSLAAVVLLPIPSEAAGDSWPTYLFDNRHTSYNGVSAVITKSNAGSLVQAWNWVPDEPTLPGQPPAQIFASPTVSSGRIFIGANTGDFYALHEATGTVAWKKFLGYTAEITCGARGFTSTAAVVRDPVTRIPTVYVAAADGYLYAMNASNGTTLWKSLVVDPGSGENAGYNWASPSVVNGRVYMGMSSQCDAPLIRGGVKEFDQHTGTLLNTYYAVDENSVGASVWTSTATTVSGSNVLLTTGNSPNDAGDSFSIVRLDGTTLAKIDSWKLPGQIGTDNDWGSSPTLFTATIGGVRTEMVTACNKTGDLYAWKKVDLAAGPVWTKNMSNGSLQGGGCFPAPVWDGTNLYAGGGLARLGGTTYDGSLRKLDPATGASIWELGLPFEILGTPTMNGAGILAVPPWDILASSDNACYLVDSATGAILGSVSTGSNIEFAQPVFAGKFLLVGSVDNGLYAYTPSS